MSNKTFKGDIERAERNLLIVSWIGTAAAIGVIVISIWGI